MILNCLNCGKSVSTQLNNCPYCKWEVAEVVIRETHPPAVRGYKEALREAPRAIINTVLRYAHKQIS